MESIDRKRSLVAIPLFNEEHTIVPVIEETRRHYSGDILVIDDGSTDQSLSLLNRFNDDRLFLHSHEKNLGYGQSLIDAFAFAQNNNYEVLVTIDCDFQHEPRSIPDFLEQSGSADIISGSRYFFDLAGNSSAPADRLRINKIITSQINQLTGLQITDAFCGFKAYRVAALSKLHITETGYAMPLQFWIQAWCAQLSVKEVPVKRIYLNLDRTFGAHLDNPDTRLEYYQQVINRELDNVSRSTRNSCASR